MVFGSGDFFVARLLRFHGAPSTLPFSKRRKPIRNTLLFQSVWIENLYAISVGCSLPDMNRWAEPGSPAIPR